MALIQWEQKGVFSGLEGIFEDDNLFPSTFPCPEMPRPTINTQETDQDITVEMNIPGLSPSSKKIDIKVLIQNGILEISGETKEDDEKEGYNLLCFQVAVSLPSNIKEDEVSAICEGEYLRIVVPKDTTESSVIKVNIE